MCAERASFFVIDRTNDEFVADMYDEGLEDGQGLIKRNMKIRFGKERGIAGAVARTGIHLNIKDAYNDPRFNKEVDFKTGFITRSILCVPIMGVDGVLGNCIRIFQFLITLYSKHLIYFTSRRKFS